MKKISHRNLRAVLRYNPLSGQWFWLVDRARLAKKGQRAGYLHHSGYRYIRLQGHERSEHRLAWFYMTGKWPKHEVDHIDNIPLNNRWKNLRKADRAQNSRNQLKQKRVRFKGVILVAEKKNNRYRARIYVNKRNAHLGYFPSEQLAHAAYVTAAKKHFGEFARAR